ncbi:hypothetical protein [Streptomyces sp. NPDC002122]|uniref:hypothetical protein n=1 Tax=Streptomyces sp. NPDC002122 TaxID=3154407 RepID=UPI003332BC76
MSARDELFHFATTQSMASEEMAERLLAKFRAEALAGAKLSADLAEEDYRRMVSAASQLQKELRARVAELEAAAVCPSVARAYGSKCVLPVRHRGDHQNEAKWHYWSDEHARPMPPRQAEDPHDSPLHHNYAESRDLPFIPQQVTGRCSQGHLFEDCTCGGTAQ